MDFTTKVPIANAASPIDYTSKIVSLGSCFAENMADKFDYFKFQNVVNPFGIIFNPVSIEKLIHRAVHHIPFTENDVFEHNQMWHCFEVHSECSEVSKAAILTKLNAVLDAFSVQLSTATHIIFTYGTSWIYRNKASNQIVANCHKVPQNQFQKELLSVTAIQQSIQNTTDLIHHLNPGCQFVFTVSPVRHIKDGFVENNVSKAHLLSAVYQSGADYFPSYEIMTDELRDYRFYAADMLHPNLVAIDYIWERFSGAFMQKQTHAIMQQVAAIQRDLQHKPFQPGSESHRKFLESLQQKIESLTQKLPQIRF